MKKRAIVSFANGAGDYIHKLERQRISLLNDHNADYVSFIGEESVGAPLHKATRMHSNYIVLTKPEKWATNKSFGLTLLWWR